MENNILSINKSTTITAGIKAIIFHILIFALCGFSAVAQETHDTYKTAIGVRGGFYPGITVKHFIVGNAALEGIIHSNTRYRGFLFTGLYELHAQAFNISRLHWFYGLGGHVGLYDRRFFRNNMDNGEQGNALIVGVDGILGMEYHITEIPFTVGLDVKPFFEILNPGYGNFDGALTIRYTF